MSNAASKITKLLNSTRPPKPQLLDGAFMQAVARRIEARGIARVPGLPADEPEPTWFDLAIEHDRRCKELLDSYTVPHETEQEGHRTPAAIVNASIASSSSTTMPLNGAAVLHAALSGGGGTINADSVSSRMDLLR